MAEIFPRGTATVVGLMGDLGSGKTAFVKKVAEILDISETVNSPTFVIEKIYKIPKKKIVHRSSSIVPWNYLIHIDAYRIEKEEELLNLGWEQIISNSENLIFIEWPERVNGVLPRDTKTIRFEFIDESKRKIQWDSE